MADRRSIHLQLKVLIIPLSSPALIAFRCRPCANTTEGDHSFTRIHTHTYVNKHQGVQRCFRSLWNATYIELAASFSNVITLPTHKRSHTVIIKPFKSHFYWFPRAVTSQTWSWPFHHPVHTRLSVCEVTVCTWPSSHTDTHYTSRGWMRSWHSTTFRNKRFHTVKR